MPPFEIEVSRLRSVGSIHFAARESTLKLLPVFVKDAIICAHVRNARTALAVEAYRRSHEEQLPTALADLAPSFLPHVPIDPFSGKPLQFRTGGKGYIIYSVGMNRRDDGGVDAAGP